MSLYSDYGCKDPRWLSDYELRNQLRECERDRCGCENSLRDELSYRERHEELRKQEEEYERMLAEQRRQREAREYEEYLAYQREQEEQEPTND